MAESLQRQSSAESQQSTDCTPLQPDDQKCATMDTQHSQDDTCETEPERLLCRIDAMLHLLQEQKEEFEYIPEIKCSSTASNGLLSVHITNIDALIGNGSFNGPLDRIFQIVYKHSWYKQNQFSAAKVVIANMNRSDNFQIKLPLRLFEYQFHFAVRAINVNTHDWFELSPFQNISVPSMLCDTAFEVGDKVLFRPHNSMSGHPAVIKEVLPNNKYQLRNHRYDASKGSRDDEAAWNEVVYTVDKSRVFRLGVDQRKQINLTDVEEIENQLLLQTNDRQNIAVFRSLMDVYEPKCFHHCIAAYDFKDCIIYYRPMAQFISKNVYDCLFQNCSQYKVNCLINPYTDGKLVLNHLREYTIRRFYFGSVNGYAQDEENASEIVNHMGVGYQCDMCYGGINQFEYVFNCSHCTPDQKHDICLNCVYNVIKLGAELEMYLRAILEDQLNDDCVCEIVDFTVGRPICIQ